MQYENEDESEPQITAEEYLRAQKSSIGKKAWWAIGIGGFVVFVHLGWLMIFGVLGAKADFSVLFRSIFFILGLFALTAGIWGIYYARNLSLEDLIPSAEAVAFIQQSQSEKPYYSYILVSCIIAVSLAQMATGLQQSIDLAGFDKQVFVDRREYWRILTGGALHGGLLHIFFNSQALRGFGTLVELLSNRVHLAIVFVLAIVGGGLLSLIFMPDATTVGASGGIMGLIGYMAIYGYRRKQQLPPDFMKSMLINIGFIAAFGIIAYQLVDNFAHVGGLLTGAVYGFVQVPREIKQDPRQARWATQMLGLIALGIFVATSLFSILLMLNAV